MAKHKRTTTPLQLMNIGDIAYYFGVSRHTAENWRKAHDDFPRPVAELGLGMKLYDRGEVMRWMSNTRARKGPRFGRSREDHALLRRYERGQGNPGGAPTVPRDS